MGIASLKRSLDATARARRRVVAVIGSGDTADPCCGDIGRLIASLGFDLLTGAGRGVMEAVSRAFHETRPRRGIVIGIVPGEVDGIERIERRVAGPPGAAAGRSGADQSGPGPAEYRVRAGYPNEWVELAIYTHLPDSGAEGTRRSSRNHINVLSADAIVALPGSAGTASEIWLAAAYGIPIIASGDHDPRIARGIAIASTIDDVRRFLVETLYQGETRGGAAQARPRIFSSHHRTPTKRNRQS